MQADPEGFIRSLDADTGPDADNPRACGVALLLCMLRKGSSHVAEAMLSYVTHLQVCMRCSALCSALRLCLAFGFCPLPLPCRLVAALCPSAFICLLALVTSWLWACWALEKIRLACKDLATCGLLNFRFSSGTTILVCLPVPSLIQHLWTCTFVERGKSVCGKSLPRRLSRRMLTFHPFSALWFSPAAAFVATLPSSLRFETNSHECM